MNLVREAWSGNGSAPDHASVNLRVVQRGFLLQRIFTLSRHTHILNIYPELQLQAEALVDRVLSSAPTARYSDGVPRANCSLDEYLAFRGSYYTKLKVVQYCSKHMHASASKTAGREGHSSKEETGSTVRFAK